MGRRPIDDANSAYASGYNVVDAGVRCAHPLKGVATTWRLTVNNIGNAHYWSTLDPGNITGTNVGSYTAHLGQPRTVAASGSLHVCHAGSLLAAFTQVEDEFRKQNPSVKVVDTSGGSVDLVRRLAAGRLECDVIARADHLVISIQVA